MDVLARKKAETDAIRLNAEGSWYYGEYPILHERTIQFLHKNIAQDEEGRFYLTGEDKPVYIRVEDAPYQVVKVERTIAGYLITLTDETIELLNPQSLWVGQKNVLYCLVKGGKFKARFSRHAYYELAKDIKGAHKQFFLLHGSHRYAIKGKPPREFLRSAELKKKTKKIKDKRKKTSRSSVRKSHARKLKKAAKRKSKKSKRR